MDNTVIVALVAAVASVLGSAIGAVTTIKSMDDVQNVKIEELTREVRLHNNFAQRMPLVEQNQEHMKQDIAEIKAELKLIKDR